MKGFKGCFILCMIRFMFNIVVNTIPLLSPLTGVGVYTYQLCRYFPRLDNTFDYTFFYGFFTKELFAYNSDSVSLRTFNKLKFYLRKIPFMGYGLRKLKSLLSHGHKNFFDLYFEPNFIPLPGIKAKQVIVTVHDFSLCKYPQWHPKDRVKDFEKNFWPNIKRADLIVTVSQYIKKEALNFLSLPAEKIKVIYNGYDRETFKLYPFAILKQFKTNFALPEKFILFIGALEPRKNLLRLIKAYLNLPLGVKKEIKLVIAGAPGWENKTVKEMIRGQKDIYYLGYVDHQGLAYLYNLATLFIYPSLYEGFGLPALESMACGCPVITSQQTSLTEVCGDAAFYVNPYDIDNITRGIYKVLNDVSLQENLREKGLERAKAFSWEKTAQEYLEIFHKVLENK